MKKFLVPVIAGVAVFGSVTAFAATLSVNGGSIGAGNATVGACNSSASVSYTGGFNTTSHVYDVASVKVTTPGPVTGPPAVAAPCDGRSYKVTLLDSSNASLGEVTGTIGTDGTDTKSVTAGVAAVSVANVAVVITG